MNVNGKRVLVTGGAGSLGKVLVERLLSGEFGAPASVVVFSRDEAKQHDGMTKALQERILIQANLHCPGTRFVIARYGDVLASRGSVIPLFLEQIQRGGPLTISDSAMTRFMMSLNDVVDTIAAAVATAAPGETIVPKAPAGRIVDLARAWMGSRQLELKFTGIRPGEKLHEILISEEERNRTGRRGGYHAIRRPAGSPPLGRKCSQS